MCLFRYKILLNINSETGFSRKKAVGVVFAKTYGKAAKYIENYYNGDLEAFEYLKIIADERVIEISPDNEGMIKDIEDNWVW